MAQCNNLKLGGLEFFWNSSSSKSHQDWEKRSEKFQLAIFGKDPVDVTNPPARPDLRYPIPEPYETT